MKRDMQTNRRDGNKRHEEEGELLGRVWAGRQQKGRQ
jgi:hypothetical protein